MKAYSEIGPKKLLKFIAFSLGQALYGVLIFPPLRYIYLSFLGAKIGKNVVIMNVKFFNWHHGGPGGLTIRDKCFVGDETLIDLYGSVTLENNVTIAQRVTVLTHINVGYQDHPLQKYFPRKVSGVHIMSGSVIGASVTILPGVTIGSKSFVAAGSVVTKDVPSRVLVAGVPAKVIRKIK